MLRLLTLLLSPCEGSRSLQSEVHGLFQCCAGIRNGTQTPVAGYYYVYLFIFVLQATIAIEDASINLSSLCYILGYTFKSKYRDFFSSHLRQLKTLKECFIFKKIKFLISFFHEILSIKEILQKM
jgi:hypothetical protein